MPIVHISLKSCTQWYLSMKMQARAKLRNFISTCIPVAVPAIPSSCNITLPYTSHQASINLLKSSIPVSYELLSCCTLLCRWIGLRHPAEFMYCKPQRVLTNTGSYPARMRGEVKQSVLSVCQSVSPLKNFEISTFTGLNNCCTRQ